MSESPNQAATSSESTGDHTPETDFVRYARTRNAALRDRIVTSHLSLVRYLASKFASRGEPMEDLIQVGTIGLINAIERFDPGRGLKFATFATPTIVGELQRYFRDKCWKLKVSRRMMELNVASMKARDSLASRLGRQPTVQEVAAEIGVSEEETLQAMELGNAYDTQSLDAQIGEGENTMLADTLGGADPALDEVLDRDQMELALAHLDPRDRAVIKGLYFDDLSQAAVGERLQISQMHVSRLHKRALAQLRSKLSGEAGNELSTT